MGENLDYIKMFAQFPFALRRFRKRRMTLAQGQQVIREQMAHRPENFLQSVERTIFGNPSSPYLPLLKMAGCEFGDLCELVKQKCVEGALHDLRAAGVYVTFEEFKGRKPIVRNGVTIPVKPSDFDNPLAQRSFTVASGGSSGAALSVGVDLDAIAARAPHELVAFSAHGVLDAPLVRWKATLPTSTLRNILMDEYIGHPTERWFSPIGLRASQHWLKYGLATYYILAWMRLQGMRVPLPEYVGQEQAGVIAQCVAAMLHEHGQCLLHATMSRGLRVARAAQEAGIDLRGATFCGSGEPTTAAKVSQIEKAGAKYIAHYGMVEAGRMGVGCAKPAGYGDVHFFSDCFALFTHPYTVENIGVTVPAFNLTTLLSIAPKVMLNFQMDDYGVVQERHCGCELEEYGYTTHLSEIRSYSKSTGEGVTLIGNEIEHLLEEVLPARFGGSALDYQLSEQEDEQGFTRLYLVISPRVEIADEGEVIQVMLNALGASSAMADAARTVWQGTQTLQIKRIEPVLTARGKLLPLHIQRHLKV